MPFVAAASRTVNAPRGRCFERFADFSTWRAWMPPSFRPLKGPDGPLYVGARLRVLLAGGPLPLPAALTVIRFERDREITWRGGVPGLLTGEHRFFFEDDGEGRTRIASQEPWTGLLAELGPVARRVKAMASRVGEEQLAGFARLLEADAAATDRR